MLRTVSFSLRHFKVSSINFWFSSAWSCGVLVRVLDLQLKGRRFDPWPFCFQVTTLGKLFTHVPLSPSPAAGKVNMPPDFSGLSTTGLTA